MSHPATRRPSRPAEARKLFPRRLAQRCVDTVLPARTVLLKKIEHVTVDAERHRFLHPRKRRRRLWWAFHRLRGRRLEGLLGRGAAIDRTSRHAESITER